MKGLLIKGVLTACIIVLAVAGAGAATIVSTQGETLVKVSAAGSWQRAQVGQALEPASEIQTQAGARCTIAFDQGRQRLAVVKEKTSVRVENLGPDEIFIKEGRVFSLIKPGSGSTDFRVKTPTAISGARGTAWETEFTEGRTSVKCLEDIVVVTGLGSAGQTLEQTDLPPGFGVSVGADGALGTVFELSNDQAQEARQDKEALEQVDKTLAPSGEAASGKEETLEPVSKDLMDRKETTLDDGMETMKTDTMDGADLVGTSPDDASIMDKDAGFDMNQDPLDMTSNMPGSDSVRDLTQDIKDQTGEKKVYDKSAEGGEVITAGP